MCPFGGVPHLKPLRAMTYQGTLILPLGRCPLTKTFDTNDLQKGHEILRFMGKNRDVSLKKPNRHRRFRHFGAEMCSKADDHCWSSWTTKEYEVDKGIFVWYLKRYCYICSLKEWV